MTPDEIEEFILSVPKSRNYNSIAGWIEALAIFSKYDKLGLKRTNFCGGEHDTIYFYIGIDKLLPASEEGKKLISLGFTPDLDSENWVKYT